MAFGLSFVTQYKNQPVDVDYFPQGQIYQCYDLWMQFVKDNYNVQSNIILSPSGFAKDLWYNFDALGLGLFFEKTDTPQLGDWAIYGNAPATPLSHVGMFLADHGSTIDLFQQNAPYPRATIGELTKQGLLGYLRPKRGESMVDLNHLNALTMAYYRRGPNREELARYVGKATYERVIEDFDKDLGGERKKLLKVLDTGTVALQSQPLATLVSELENVIDKYRS